MNVRLELDSPFLEPILYGGYMSLCFCHACCYREEGPHDRLRCYSLDPVNRPDEFVFIYVYLYIGGIVYYRDDYRYKQLPYC